VGVAADSTFLVDLIKGDRGARGKAADLDARRESRLLSTPVLYEVLVGILFRGSRQEAEVFAGIASRFTILPFDERSARRAAEIQTELLRAGRPKSHADVMIASVAAEGGHSLVTRDRDFQDIAAVAGLTVETY